MLLSWGDTFYYCFYELFDLLKIFGLLFGREVLFLHLLKFYLCKTNYFPFFSLFFLNTDR